MNNESVQCTSVCCELTVYSVNAVYVNAQSHTLIKLFNSPHNGLFTASVNPVCWPHPLQNPGIRIVKAAVN